MEKHIRTIEVEFLRSGPPHNQLLSPLTQYLAVCGEAGAGTVTMPFEQAAFNRRLADLRYSDDEEQDQSPRLETLRTVGTALGEVLGGVPGLVGSLSDRPGSATLTNLRIVTSASELAMLPFELAKVPAAVGRPSDEWLSLRAGAPVCVTRRERSVGPTKRRWSDVRPKVLFVVGMGIDKELECRHRAALSDALDRWRHARDPKRPNPYLDNEPLCQLGGQSEERDGPCTVPRIRRELEAGVTLVHFLAHGAPSDTAEGDKMGLLLQGDDPEGEDPCVPEDQRDEKPPSSLVVTGEQLASVLRSLPLGSQQPWGVVLASCDSAYQADLLVPGGSFARALHVAGVPLVLASQFPLTYDGSTLMIKMLAKDIFWGHNPLLTIASIRAEMHAELGISHDWASLVVYEALPHDLDAQLDRVAYDRTRFALDIVVSSMKSWDREKVSSKEAEAEAEAVLGRLPASDDYEIDRLSLRAYHSKRVAETYALGEDTHQARRHLAAARQRYQAAAHNFLQGKVSKFGANLHWMQTQAISLDRVLGQEPRRGEWDVAWQAARRDLDAGNRETRQWARSDLAELALLAMLESEDANIEEELASTVARKQVKRLVDDDPDGPNNRVAQSVKAQMERYAGWFGSFDRPAQDEAMAERWLLVVKLARELVADFLDDGSGN